MRPHGHRGKKPVFEVLAPAGKLDLLKHDVLRVRAGEYADFHPREAVYSLRPPELKKVPQSHLPRVRGESVAFGESLGAVLVSLLDETGELGNESVGVVPPCTFGRPTRRGGRARMAERRFRPPREESSAAGPFRRREPGSRSPHCEIGKQVRACSSGLGFWSQAREASGVAARIGSRKKPERRTLPQRTGSTRKRRPLIRPLRNRSKAVCATLAATAT